jgi:hypothetical protein
LPDDLSKILSYAFEVVPGVEYNQRLSELTAKGARYSRWIFYEVSLREAPTRAHLLESVYPSIIRYLRAKSLSIDDPEGVVVAIFFEEDCHLLMARDFLAGLREMSASG